MFFRRALCRTILLLLACAFCLYLETLSHSLFADDEIYLAYANRFLRHAPMVDLWQLLVEPKNPWEFLPIRDFTYWLDFRLFGDEFWGFHFSNLLWYAACLMAAYGFFRRIAGFCRPALKHSPKCLTLLSLAGLLFFAAHPAHVEVVAWVASRKDLIAATFGFWSFAVLIRAVEARLSQWKCAGAALLFFAACFGKSTATAYVLFASLVLIASYRKGASGNTRYAWLWPLAVFWLAFALAFFIHLAVGAGSGIQIENHPGFLTMIERASRILSALTGILVFPYPSRFYYDVYGLGAWHWLVSAGLLGLSAVSVVRAIRARSLWAFGVLLAVSPLAVYAQFVPFSTWSLACERFVFVSVAGLSLILIDGLLRVNTPRAFAPIVFLLVLPCLALTWNRVADWGGIGNALIDREYALAPNFHNAIRDRILFTLTPEKRYDEARRLAQRLRRDYAATAMTRMIEADERYLPFRGGLGAPEDNAATRAAFCGALDKLVDSIQAGSEAMKTESDISYNSILNLLKRAKKYRFGNAGLLCKTPA